MRRTCCAIFLMALLLLAGCGPAEPGTADAAFDKLVSVVEEKDIEGLDSILAEDFVGDSDRLTTMSMARQVFKRGPKPSVTILSQDKEERGTRATFRTKMLITAGGGVFPRHSARLQVDTQWEKKEGAWKLRVAQWHRL